MSTSISIGKLPPNIPHKINSINDTNHPYYGTGLQIIIESPDNIEFRVQLPTKYSKHLTPDEVNAMRQDIINGRNPYFIFREILQDKSYRIDIVEKSALSDTHFLHGTNMPELPE